MNFSIRYLTEYRYDAEVIDNLNALRVRPATTINQRCDEFVVRVSPEARLHRHPDYFGTEVIEFGISKPHEQLTVDVRARVATTTPPDPPEAPWEALAAPAYQEAAGEFLLQTAALPQHDVFADLLQSSRATTPLATLLLLTELIPDHFEYRRGATFVDSTVADLLEAGAGVCQDFVHLALMLLRAQGIAARYVSGYLFAAPADGGEDSIEVDTHAYVQALLPAPEGTGELVWVGADPTNRGLTAEQHVKIGHGRHYADVLPVKGVYRGNATASLESAVTMTRLDASSTTRA